MLCGWRINAKNLKVVAISSSQTPFFRHLRKHSGRLIYGSKKSHWYQWNPGLELNRPTETDTGVLRYRSKKIVELLPLANLRDSISGEAVCIVGSGPSIVEMNLNSLLGKVNIILNGAIFLKENYRFSPSVFCVEDERFVWSHFEKFASLVPMETACIFTPAVMRALCEISVKWIAKRPIYMIESVKKPYLKSQLVASELGQIEWLATNDTDRIGFSLDPSAGIFFNATVAYSAFQIGVSLDPSTIGFAGIDLTVDPKRPRFYNTSKGAAWSGLNRSRSKILEGFKLGKKIATQKGINLENYSLKSSLNEIGITYSKKFERGQEATNGD